MSEFLYAICAIAACICFVCFWSSMAEDGDHVGKLYVAWLVFSALAYGFQVMA